MKSKDNTRKEQDGRSMGGYVMDLNTTRKRDTIRHNKSESYLNKVFGNRVEGKHVECGPKVPRISELPE